jgi:hypothetical protein
MILSPRCDRQQDDDRARLAVWAKILSEKVALITLVVLVVDLTWR